MSQHHHRKPKTWYYPAYSNRSKFSKHYGQWRDVIENPGSKHTLLKKFRLIFTKELVVKFYNGSVIRGDRIRVNRLNVCGIDIGHGPSYSVITDTNHLYDGN